MNATRTLSGPAAVAAIAQAERLLHGGIWQSVALAAAVGLTENADPQVAARARVLLDLYWREARPVGCVVDLPSRPTPPNRPQPPAGGDAA